MFPVHVFSEVAVERDTLRLALINPEWIQDQLTRRKIRLAHEEIEDGGFLLTASTKDLQKVMLKHADDPEMFSDEDNPFMSLHRYAPPSAPEEETPPPGL